MKQIAGLIIATLAGCLARGGVVEKTFFFGNPSVEQKGIYRTVNFPNTVLSGIPGEPQLPWHTVALLLPPGEEAVTVELIPGTETSLPGPVLLFPQQPPRPTGWPGDDRLVMNTTLYQSREAYPVQRTGHLMTQYLNGYGLALCSFTPAIYYPADRMFRYSACVTVRVTSRPAPEASRSLANRRMPGRAGNPALALAMNPEMAGLYPPATAPLDPFDYLIVSPVTFKNEFQPLISLYSQRGLSLRVVTTDSIIQVSTGYDLQEKIRNFIIGQYQNHGIDYVLLAGLPPLLPARGFYCQVNSSGTYYTDASIPADLYFSGLDGNYDANGNHIYAEIADNPDLLPDLSVARFTVTDTAALHRMIRKTIAYQTDPVPGEFAKPLLAGEYLYHDPITFGSDYMDLLIDNHGDNGYFTHGIPSATNQITTLYDTLISASPLNYWQWSAAQLLTTINQGNSFIHHLGHANTTYMMRLNMSSVTNANFSQVNGIIHNFQFLYTQGCYDGAFDASGGCIAAKAVSIDNWLVAGVFNSRYGWFNQGTTDGPSQHLQREFVNALYTDTLPDRHIGTAHRLSKIETASFVSLPGEFEPGAQRWVHYCCNVFGDPALEIFTQEPDTFHPVTWTGAIDSDWNKPGNWNPGRVPGSLSDITIPDTPNDPVVNTLNTNRCHHLTVLGGANITIPAGKSLVVYGTVTMGAP